MRPSGLLRSRPIWGLQMLGKTVVEIYPTVDLHFICDMHFADIRYDITVVNRCVRSVMDLITYLYV